jgi:hypothetical protein
MKTPRKYGAQKKRPRKSRGLKSNSFGVPLRDAARLLFLLGGGFLLRSFLGCVLHRVILPNIKFCDQKNRNVIHI